MHTNLYYVSILAKKLTYESGLLCFGVSMAAPITLHRYIDNYIHAYMTQYICISKSAMYVLCHHTSKLLLTGSSTVTVPSNLTTWGCLNWAMRAASWRNVALRLSVDPSFSILMATSCGPFGVTQVPLNTSPNSPDPRAVSALQRETLLAKHPHMLHGKRAVL